ncbi:MAG: hypothetical protein ABS35_34215 [Kaistia sp. SCN 65-12]|nr:hypothetical protein [Hyphomicrobiales bacterium]ODT14594.1 MAG: hypothetical protein ABS35_34215 [Kaistia sp. SCN 65-12]
MASTTNSPASAAPSGCGTCRNCSSLFWGIGVGLGLRCVNEANKGRALSPTNSTPKAGFPYPVIPSRDFGCPHFETRTA